MKIEGPLIEGTLILRYKRFLADVELADGRRLTVHCPNSGRMTACSEPGRPVLISDSENPKRKLRYTLEMIRMGRTWVGVNTGRPNRVVRSLIEADRIPELQGYEEVRPEVFYGPEKRSRIDLRLTPGDGDPRPPCWVEIKNSTLRVDEREGDEGRLIPTAAFPDAVSARGTKHLEELTAIRRAGERAVIFFFIGRADCRRFRPADEIDPVYGRALRDAVAAGVEILAYRMRFTRDAVHLVDRLPVTLPPVP